MNDPTCTRPKRDQVLEHLMLGVNRNRAAISEVVKVDPVTAATEAQFDAVVHKAFAL
jgi:hypothetical protein